MSGGDDILRAVETAEVLQFPRAKRAHAAAEGGSDAIETPKAADFSSHDEAEARAAAPLAAAAGAAAGAAAAEKKSSRAGALPNAAPAADEGERDDAGEPRQDTGPPDLEDEFRRDDGPTGGSLDERLAFLPMTDLGNADRFYARFKDRFRYCDAIGWLAWDGRRWNGEQADAQVMLAEHECVRAIQDEAEAIADTPADFVYEEKGSDKNPILVMFSDKLRAWGRASESANRIAAVSKRAAPMLQIGIDKLDRDPMRFNVLNGTLVFDKDVEGYVRITPHNPDDLITKLAPVIYDPAAACPQYDAFLARVQPPRADDGQVQTPRFLHQWAGLAMTGETGEQRYTFHYGKGRNGKGVWVSTVAHVLGDYAGSIRIESFLDSGRATSGGQATPDIAKLPGVRFLSTSEPKKGATLDEGLVKLFTGEDTISARHLNKGFFDFKPVAKLTMQGNYRPKISGTDEGIWNRTILVPWPVFIPKDERDPKLAHKLHAEASGILNRFLDGLRDWMDRGLLLPGSVTAATEDYRADSDPLGRFLDACTRPQIDKRVQSSEMHALFAAWAKANGEAEWTPKGLAMALRERGLAAKKSVNVYWLDIELTKRVSDFIGADGKALRDGEIGPGGPGDDMEPAYD